MTDIIDFSSHLDLERRLNKAYFDRMHRAVDCCRILARAIAEMRDAGADSRTIAGQLLVAVEAVEVEALEAGMRDREEAPHSPTGAA